MSNAMLGDGFDHVHAEIPRALLERVRDEAQVLAAQWASSGYALVAAPLQPDRGTARAIGFITGAAMALGLTPRELLAACGAEW